jgi:hypothetical protein
MTQEGDAVNSIKPSAAKKHRPSFGGFDEISMV